MIDRATFLADRKSGVGGSDIASLFNVGYGCRRRLFYDKTNQEPDFPEIPKKKKKLVELGNVLEPHFAAMYADETGRKTTAHSSPFWNSEIPLLRVNVDRSVDDPGIAKFGVLEIKAMGRGAFYQAKREGLPQDYILQLQAGMLASGLSWGSFAIGSRDSGELVWFDVEPSEALCAEITAEVPRFWETVEAAKNVLHRPDRHVSGVLDSLAPPRLEPDDRRCQSCEFRTTCQGSALVQLHGVTDSTGAPLVDRPDLRGVLDEYDTRKNLFDQAEELLEETKARLCAEIDKDKAVVIGKRKVYYREQAGRTMYDGKGLVEVYRKALVLLKQAEDGDGFLRDFEQLSKQSPESFISASKPSWPLRVF